MSRPPCAADTAGCPGTSDCSFAGAAGSRVRSRVTPAIRRVPPGLGPAVGEGLGDVALAVGLGVPLLLHAAAARATMRSALPARARDRRGYGLRISRCRGLRLSRLGTGSALVQQTEAD